MAINFSDIGKQIQAGTSQLNSQLNTATSQLNTQLNAATSQISTVTKQVSNITSQFNSFIGSAESNLSIPSKFLQNPLSDIANNLDVALNENLNRFQSGINTAISQIDPALNFRFSEITDVGVKLSTGINQITSQIDGNIGDFVSSLSGISNQITQNFSQQFGQLEGALGNLTQGLSGFTASIPDFSQQLGQLNQLTGQLGNLSQGLTQGLSGLTSSIPNIPADFGNISANVSNFTSKLDSGLQNLQNKISNVTSLTNALSNPGQFISNKINGIIDSGLERLLGPIKNITSIGSSLANSIFGGNQITVLSGLAENITQGVGKLFDISRESFENRFDGTDLNLFSSGSLLSGNNSSITGILGQNYSSGSSNSNKFNTSRVPNPLRNHNTYNYIITLGSISKNSYNTGAYKDTGLDKIILRSGGGEYNRRITTAEEDRLGEHLEYFIEDLEIDAVIAPNQNTGVSLGTTMTFKIVEPYSMGQLIEAMQIAAKEAGFDNYIQGVFGLKIEFVGWDELGKQSKRFVEKPIYIPIKFLKMDFSVTESGSEYECEAITYSETATDDIVNKTNTQITANGATVSKVLENSRDSVTGVINDQIEELEEKKKIPKGDRYLIVFPKDKNDIYEIISQNSNVKESQLLTDPVKAELETQGIDNITPGDPDTTAKPNQLIEDFKGAPPIYRMLKQYALDESRMNAIGTSALNNDTRAGSNQSFTPAPSAVNENLDVNRSTPESGPTPNSRTYQYNENYTITSLIEDVILDSEYAQKTINDIREGTSDLGKYSWFRIEPMTFIEDLRDAEKQMGRPIYTYVYAVYVSVIDEAKMLGSNKRPKGTEDLKSNVAKEYSYYYTGQNEDIINFDINFNMAFYNVVSVDLNAGRVTDASSTAKTPAQLEKSIDPAGNLPSNSKEANSPQQIGTQESNVTKGSMHTTVNEQKRRDAVELHNRIINSPVDMITAEMEIWGDPYFIPNYQGVQKPLNLKFNIDSDGTMNYLSNEIMIIINFRTPLDYQINGFVMNFPELVKPFSGLFSVWAVTNTFSEGVFKQTLKLIRRTGQSDPGSNASTPYKTLDQRDAANEAAANASSAREFARRRESGEFDDTILENSTVDGLSVLKRRQQAAARASLEAQFGLDVFGGTGRAISGVDSTNLDAFGGSGRPISGVNTPPRVNPDSSGPF